MIAFLIKAAYLAQIVSGPSSQPWSFDPTAEYSFTGHVCLVVPRAVKICNNGTITVDEGVKPDEAARTFLKELKKTFPSMFNCEQ